MNRYHLFPDPYICEYCGHGNWPLQPSLCSYSAWSAAHHLPWNLNHHHNPRGRPNPRPARLALLPPRWPSQRPSGLPPARSPGGEVHVGPDPSTAPLNGARQGAPHGSPASGARRQLGNRRRGDSVRTHVQHAPLSPLPPSNAPTPQYGALHGKPANIREHQRTPRGTQAEAEPEHRVAIPVSGLQ